MLRRVACFTCFVGLSGLLSSQSFGAITLIDQFDPAALGGLNGIAFDPVSDRVYVHGSFLTDIHYYSRTGTPLGMVPDAGDAGNDSDYEFADVPVTINGTVVPANTLLIVENDSDPPRIIGADKNTGAAIAGATQTLNGVTIGQLVGGSYHPQSGTFFLADHSSEVIREVNAGNGAILNSFPVQPVGSPAFQVNFGDVEVLAATGNLYVVTNDTTNEGNEKIRVLSPTGTWLEDIDLEALGIAAANFSGIAFDEDRGEAWLSSTGGPVYHLGGFPIPEPATLGPLTAGGFLMLRRRR